MKGIIDRLGFRYLWLTVIGNGTLRQCGMITEKVIGTRLGIAAVERLEQLATLKDKTVSQLVRMAVERLLEAEERTLHPLSLDAAVSLASSLKLETTTVIENTSNLVSTSFGNAGGVYLLVNQETRELYVGSSTELTARLTHHKFSIKTGTHKNSAINGWVVDDVVVVILESCDGVKNAAGKKALLAREQHYIDTLKLSKEWTVLNLVDASTGNSERRSSETVGSSPSKETPQSNTSKGRRSSETVGSPSKETPTVISGGKTPPPFESFYSNVIEQELIPVLDEQTNSRDVVRLYEGCKDEQEKRWFLEFLSSYNSSWLNGLASTGKFPWIANLLELVKATPANTNF